MNLNANKRISAGQSREKQRHSSSFPRFTIVFLSIAALLLSIFVAGRELPHAGAASSKSNTVLAPALQGNLSAHDPSMIKQGNTWYVFSTGGGLQIRTSTDLIHWRLSGVVFSKIPSWITQAEGNITDLWAPDISYANGVYHLYYAGSQFGKNTSVIGLATNKTLDATSSQYQWVDQGLVIRSTRTDNFNAIDPNFSYDAHHIPWLALGSFWSGLKLRRLDPVTFKLSTVDTRLYSIAQRPSPDAIEASSITYHSGYYYLFASIDYCCKGSSSTYKIVYGRSTSITGPYVSENGTPMTSGGYTLLLQSYGNVRGPGGQTAYIDGGRTLLIHHYYDASANGAVKFQIRQILWTSTGWLTLSAPIS